jgi:hypothetical protein
VIGCTKGGLIAAFFITFVCMNITIKLNNLQQGDAALIADLISKLNKITAGNLSADEPIVIDCAKALGFPAGPDWLAQLMAFAMGLYGLTQLNIEG